MARFEHTVSVTALDRGWFEEAAGAVVGLVDASREGPGGVILLPDGRPVDGLRLLGGRHLRPGARYGSTREPGGPGDAAKTPPGAGAARASQSTVLRQWRPARSVEAEGVLKEGSLAVRFTVRLRDPRAPGTLDLSFSGHDPDGGRLFRFSGRGRADPAAWWAAADRPHAAPAPARAPVSGRMTHRLARARLTLVPSPAEDGSWRVSAVLSVRGRGLLRPVGAVVLFFARASTARGFREAVESAAAQWNTALAELTPLHGEALTAQIADELTEPPGPGDG